jgi:hypothetical protein
MTDRGGEADLEKVRTVPVGQRPNKVRGQDFARPPGRDRSFLAFMDSLPKILQARSFWLWRTPVAGRPARPPVVCMLGGHIVKTGVGPGAHRPGGARRGHAPGEQRRRR